MFMKITKFGQCCLLIEINGKRILTDPGVFSTKQNELTDIDLILITHEHADHLHTESLTIVMKNNPKAEVVTNEGVGLVLDELNIPYSILQGNETAEKAGLQIEAFDGVHEEIYKGFGLVQNTGYFIAKELFYPGDAYTEPGKEVPILALPVAGPWCKVPEAIAYALAVKPKKAFPVHDAMLSEVGIKGTYSHFERELSARNIAFIPIRENETREL